MSEDQHRPSRPAGRSPPLLSDITNAASIPGLKDKGAGIAVPTRDQGVI